MKKPIKKGLEPLVSIITPLYNAAPFIAQSIRSIQAQSYHNWEHIIVDDASTDGAVLIVKECAKRDGRIQLITLSRNKGAAHARNKATEVASGEYIAFLDADDLWHPEKLCRQITFMQENNCAVSYTGYHHMDEYGKQLGKRVHALEALNFKKQHRNNYIGNLTGIYNATLLGKISAPNIRKRQDWALWLEAIKRSGKPALGIQEDLASYRVRANSMSAHKLDLVKYNFQFYRTYLGYSWIKSVWWLLRFFWEYFMVRPRWIESYSVK